MKRVISNIKGAIIQCIFFISYCGFAAVCLSESNIFTQTGLCSVGCKGLFGSPQNTKDCVLQ